MRLAGRNSNAKVDATEFFVGTGHERAGLFHRIHVFGGQYNHIGGVAILYRLLNLADRCAHERHVGSILPDGLIGLHKFYAEYANARGGQARRQDMNLGRRSACAAAQRASKAIAVSAMLRPRKT